MFFYISNLLCFLILQEHRVRGGETGVAHENTEISARLWVAHMQVSTNKWVSQIKGKTYISETRRALQG